MLKRLVCFLLCAALLFSCCAFAADSDPQPDTALTLDDFLEAYQSHDSAQLQRYWDFLGMTGEEEQEPTIAPRWESGGTLGKKDGVMCHQELTGYGFLWYIASMQNLFGKQGSQMGFTLVDASIMIEGSHKPDHEPLAWFTQYRGHFYDPDTGTNFRNGTDLTAKTSIVSEYQQAVSAFQSGDRTKAMEKLGRALHFLQDVNEPHHAANITVTDEGSQHEKFEEYASQRLLEEFMTADMYAIGDTERDFYTGYLTRSVGDSLHEAARSGKAWIGWAQSTNDVQKRVCAYFTLGNAMLHTSGLLYRFAKDTRMI